MKVGLELYSAAGPEAITTLVDLGVDVFCDLKLHDIPNTVHRAARVIGALGARYLTIHTAGGVPMVRAGVEGLREGAAGVEGAEPTALGRDGADERARGVRPPAAPAGRRRASTAGARASCARPSTSPRCASWRPAPSS